jgi:2,4-dienoyl-CoA reductase-like NADH-dependent reductase (Old Yellow Enzyme family)
MTGIPQEKESTRSREAYFLEYAQKVRSHTKLPLMLTGGFRSREGMEEALQSGAVDLIGLARPLALEPEFPRRLLAGENAVSKVAPKKTGVKQLDGLMEVAWFSHQLHRMGEGKEPDPELWPWTVVGKMAWNSISSMFSGG